MTRHGGTAEDRRARLMRGIHGACRRLGLDDDARHDVQIAVTGKGSLRDMDARDLARLIAHLNRLQGRTGGTGRGRGARHHARAVRGDVRLIHALWGDLGRRGALQRPDRAGLNAFIRARFAAHWSYVPLDVDMLGDAACITDVIRALQSMLQRAARKPKEKKS